MCKYRQRRFMNGHITGFRPQTQKLESHYKTPSGTLAVNELNKVLTLPIEWNLV